MRNIQKNISNRTINRSKSVNYNRELADQSINQARDRKTALYLDCVLRQRLAKDDFAHVQIQCLIVVVVGPGGRVNEVRCGWRRHQFTASGRLRRQRSGYHQHQFGEIVITGNRHDCATGCCCCRDGILLQVLRDCQGNAVALQPFHLKNLAALPAFRRLFAVSNGLLDWGKKNQEMMSHSTSRIQKGAAGDEIT